jgi:hypothetical protein
MLTRPRAAQPRELKLRPEDPFTDQVITTARGGAAAPRRLISQPTLPTAHAPPEAPEGDESSREIKFANK